MKRPMSVPEALIPVEPTSWIVAEPMETNVGWEVGAHVTEAGPREQRVRRRLFRARARHVKRPEDMLPEIGLPPFTTHALDDIRRQRRRVVRISHNVTVRIQAGRQVA